MDEVLVEKDQLEADQLDEDQKMYSVQKALSPFQQTDPVAQIKTFDVNVEPLIVQIEVAHPPLFVVSSFSARYLTFQIHEHIQFLQDFTDP